MLSAQAGSESYDAIVVGCGATGGCAAKRLSEAGLKVGLLEAGRKISPKEFTEHMPAYKLKNLFVMDGACYPSSACQSPTLTFMALTVRACDRLIERYKKNEV